MLLCLLLKLCGTNKAGVNLSRMSSLGDGVDFARGVSLAAEYVVSIIVNKHDQAGRIVSIKYHMEYVGAHYGCSIVGY